MLPQVISRAESYRRVLNEYKDWNAYYFLNYDGCEVIDAVRYFGLVRAGLQMCADHRCVRFHRA